MLPDQVFRRDQSEFADGLRAGRYLHRRRGHVDMPVIVWWGPPADMEAGTEISPQRMERSPRWHVLLAGVNLVGDERVDPRGAMARIEDVWPSCQNLPVGGAETDYRDARIDYARHHDPYDPYAHRRGRVDLLTASIPD